MCHGQVWLGTGADLGGSLRIPASFCGIVGMRPSVGLVPQSFAGFNPLKTVSGPMARDVEDLALMLDAMCGQHPRYDQLLCAMDIHARLASKHNVMFGSCRRQHFAECCP